MDRECSVQECALAYGGQQIGLSLFSPKRPLVLLSYLRLLKGVVDLQFVEWSIYNSSHIYATYRIR